jgi:hypothetical protein
MLARITEEKYGAAECLFSVSTPADETGAEECFADSFAFVAHTATIRFFDTVCLLFT